MSQSAETNFLDDEFHRVRLFDHKTAGHRFIFLPVDKAIQWLDVMTSNDATQLLSSAATRIDEQEYRDALALLDRAAGLPSSDTEAIARHRKLVDDAAKPEADALLAAIDANADGSWVDDFLTFRTQFGFSDSARPVMAAYGKLRTQHQPKADLLYQQSRSDLRAKKRDDAYQKYQEVVDKYYASSRYFTMKRWIVERRD